MLVSPELSQIVTGLGAGKCAQSSSDLFLSKGEVVAVRMSPVLRSQTLSVWEQYQPGQPWSPHVAGGLDRFRAQNPSEVLQRSCWDPDTNTVHLPPLPGPSLWERGFRLDFSCPSFPLFSDLTHHQILWPAP